MPLRREQCLGLAGGCRRRGRGRRALQRLQQAPQCPPGTLRRRHCCRQQPCMDTAAVGRACGVWTARALLGLLRPFVKCRRCSSPAQPGHGAGATPPSVPPFPCNRAGPDSASPWVAPSSWVIPEPAEPTRQMLRNSNCGAAPPPPAGAAGWGQSVSQSPLQPGAG